LGLLDPAARRARILAALRASEEELDRRNATPAGRLALRIARLHTLLGPGRLPRVAALGRRGSGKSSVLNALVGAPVATVGDVEDTTRAVAFMRLELAGRAVEWLDTPGLRAGGVRARAHDVAAALTDSPPDVVLLLCQATEVDAGIDDDLADAALVLRALRRAGTRAPAVLGVVTKADELPPPDALAPPFDADKLVHIHHAVGLFGRHLGRTGLGAVGVIPVCAYQRTSGGGTEQLLWNIDPLRRRIAGLLPDSARLFGVRAEELRRLLAGTMTDLGDAFAAVADATARGALPEGPRRGSAVRAELEAIQATLVRLLRGLAPQPARGAGLGGVVQALARPDGVLELLRRGTSGVGARGASGAIAAARVRALVGTHARLLLGGLDDAAFESLFDPPMAALRAAAAENPSRD
jgi:predicted GTPase